MGRLGRRVDDALESLQKEQAENKRLRGVLQKMATDECSDAEDEWDMGWNAHCNAIKGIAKNALKPIISDK